jgi:hypothetical protein
MWQLDNRTPFAAGQGWIRDRRGAETWLVVVKASFDIGAGGSTEVAKEQPEPVRIPEHWDEPGKSSLRFDNDFVLTKATTDILVVGHAHTPGGRPMKQLDAGLRVGEVQKVLRVFGDRAWGALGPGEPEPFTVMPLVYERAFGGVDSRSDHPDVDWDWRNPVGCGYATKAAHLQGVPVPNVEAPGRLIRSWSDRPAPAGFGAIASHWQPRAALAGTYDAKWEQSRQPLLPDDCDDRFFQSAPADQQTKQFLAGGEPVTLLNLSPLGRLDFLLPRFELSMETRFADGEWRRHGPIRLHTVVFEPDLPRVSLVWHSSLECHAKVFQLERTLIEWNGGPLDEDADQSVNSLLDLV